jgi:DNA polymerase III subunit epsilon
MTDERFAFLRRAAADGDAVALHIEADSFDAATATPQRIAAVRISGNHIQSGHRCLIDCTTPPHPDQIIRLLRQIGGRPIVGFFVEFSMTLLNRLTLPLTGAALTNARTEISSLYYEYKPKTPGKNVVDLRLASILQDLHLPPRPTPGAVDTAVASALIWLRLRQRER